MTALGIDIAISYASEQEEYVEAVVVNLRETAVNVWYAPFTPETLWGEDLIQYLDRIFRHEARYCVMFISKEYVSKAWPSHERRSALSRQLREQEAYILPVRFDDSEVPGLNPDVGFVRADDYSPEELSKLIQQRIDAKI